MDPDPAGSLRRRPLGRCPPPPKIGFRRVSETGLDMSPLSSSVFVSILPSASFVRFCRFFPLHILSVLCEAMQLTATAVQKASAHLDH